MTARDTDARGGAADERDETWPSLESIGDEESSPDLISPSQLIRYLDHFQDAPDDGDEEIGDTADLPRITRMPEGITVDERRVGRAVAQWILHVRCECGRRWFEVEAVDTATCPRCGVLVYVDVDMRSLRK